MRRRDFIASLMIATATRRAQAQQTGKVYRIALAHLTVPIADQNQASKVSFIIPAIFEQMTRLGYVEGRNLLIDRYSSEGPTAPDLARQIVSWNPDLIVAFGSFFVLDVKAATSTIPIVGIFRAPIELGIVPSLARPGGNVTGVTVDVSGGGDIWAKRVQLLKEAVPQVTRLGFLETRNWRDRFSAEKRDMALKSSVSLVGPPLEQPTDEQEYHRVFAALAQEGAEGLVVGEEGENNTFRRLIVELAAKGRLPTIYSWRGFVEVGGLMSYGTDSSDHGRRVADMVDKILKGAKPADIPIYQPTKFELSINLKTAKTLGIELPPLLVARADNVIE